MRWIICLNEINLLQVMLKPDAVQAQRKRVAILGGGFTAADCWESKQTRS